MFKRLSITYKLMLSYALLILCVLLLTAAFVLPMQTREHPLYDGFAACRDTGAAGDGRLVEIDGRSCIVSTVPVDREGLFHIVMLILRDRTEVVRLTEQVTDTNHSVWRF